MPKKYTLKGWCLPEVADRPVYFIKSWSGKLCGFVFKYKGNRLDYHPDCWPPKRVTVTVEVED
jgi:hypothetical protein